MPTTAAPRANQRERILDVALQLMSERGSSAMSMRQLAQACGVQVAAIYHYFPSKDELLRSVVEERRYSSRLVEMPLDLELTDQTCLAHLRALQPATCTPDPLEASCEAVTDRLIALCASIPDSEASPALTVLAYYAWVNGKGTIASLALDRALAAQPDYALARLLDRMVSMGIRLR